MLRVSGFRRTRILAGTSKANYSTSTIPLVKAAMLVDVLRLFGQLEQLDESASFAQYTPNFNTSSYIREEREQLKIAFREEPDYSYIKYVQLLKDTRLQLQITSTNH